MSASSHGTWAQSQEYSASNTAPSSLATSPSEEEFKSRPLEFPAVCSHLAQDLTNIMPRIQLAVRFSIKYKNAQRSCEKALGQPFLCLDCGSTWCGISEIDPHFLSHASDSPTHALYYDIKGRKIFCAICRNYVTHPDLIRAIALETIATEETVHKHLPWKSRPQVILPSYSAWKASKKFGLESLACQHRGIKNLGQTCFISVVLQALLNNPFIHAYYLADNHSRFTCPHGAHQKGENHQSCLSCCMDELVSNMYDSSSDAPIAKSVASVLHLIWKQCPDLSGYAQQDAHEFLISALNILHSTSHDARQDDKCRCIIHTAFSGVLKSQVTCTNCNYASKSYDPFLDLNLQLHSAKGLPGTKVVTLEDCLHRFTAAESLPAGEYKCSNCASNNMTAYKQMSLRKLPPVLCIQLKRFEHFNGSHKVDTFVKFPYILNMKAFSSLAKRSPLQLAKPQKATPAKSQFASWPESLFNYELSSVIVHEGPINSGHYTAYCRVGDQFYFFDDDKVSRVDRETVLEAKAYLLIYVKTSVTYSNIANHDKVDASGSQ